MFRRIFDSARQYEKLYLLHTPSRHNPQLLYSFAFFMALMRCNPMDVFFKRRSLTDQLIYWFSTEIR